MKLIQFPPLLRNPNGRHTHPRAHAHARHANLLLPSSQLIQQRADLPRAGAAERVAERNSAALGVDLADIQAQLLDAEDALGGESLVDLVDIDIVLGQAGLLEGDGDGGGGTDAHEQRRHADDGGLDELAEDRLAEAQGGAALHEQHGGGAVADLRRVASVDASILCEGGSDLAQRLGRHAGAHAVVFRDRDALLLVRLGVLPQDVVERHDLLVEEPLLLRLLGLLERGRREGVLLRPLHALVLGHGLRQHAHGHLAVLGFRDRVEQLREFADGLGTVRKREKGQHHVKQLATLCPNTRDQLTPPQGMSNLPILRAHALHTRTDAHLNHARLDRIRNIHARLQAGAALAVQALDAARQRKPGRDGSSTELGGAAAGGQHGADGHVLDDARIDLGAGDQRLEGADEQVRGLGVLEAALAALGDGRAQGAGDDDLVVLEKTTMPCDHDWIVL